MKPADLAALAAAVDLTDSDIEQAAERIAGRVQRMAGLWKAQRTPEPVALKYLRAIAKRHHVALPTKDGFTQRVNAGVPGSGVSLSPRGETRRA